MILAVATYHEVVKAWYHGTTVKTSQLVVEMDTGDVFYLNNFNYDADCMALQFIAFCGCRPSNSPDCLIGKQVPLTVTEDLEYMLPRALFKQGRARLENASWFV